MITSTDGISKSKQLRKLSDTNSLRDHVVLVDWGLVRAAAGVTDMVLESELIEPNG